MNKLLAILFVVLLIAGLIFGGCTQQAKGPVELSIVMFVTDIPPGNYWTHMLADKVASKSNGELTIKIVGGPEAIPTPDLAPAVQRGSIDMGDALGIFMDSLAPGIDCLGRAEYTPDVLRTNGCLDFVQELCNKSGLYLLGAASPCEAQQMIALFLNKEVKTFDDLKGLKIAAVGGDHKPMIEGFGSVCVPMSFMDYYTAMERGTIDGYTLGVPGIQDFGLEPVTAYMLDELFGSNGALFIVNLELWNKLSKAHKDILIEAAIETEIEGVDVFTNLCDKVKKDVTAAGVKVIKFASHDDSVKYYKNYRDNMGEWDRLKHPKNGAELQKLTLDPNFYRLK